MWLVLHSWTSVLPCQSLYLTPDLVRACGAADEVEEKYGKIRSIQAPRPSNVSQADDPPGALGLDHPRNPTQCSPAAFLVPCILAAATSHTNGACFSRCGADLRQLRHAGQRYDGAEAAERPRVRRRPGGCALLRRDCLCAWPPEMIQQPAIGKRTAVALQCSWCTMMRLQPRQPSRMHVCLPGAVTASRSLIVHNLAVLHV